MRWLSRQVPLVATRKVPLHPFTSNYGHFLDLAQPALAVFAGIGEFSEESKGARPYHDEVTPLVVKRLKIASTRSGDNFAPLSSHQISTAI
jgi:hypothetical protein